MMKPAYVYIMASARNGTLYVGVTRDLVRRVTEHRDGAVAGFTTKYACKSLVWCELHDRIDIAIQREKHIKEWRRAWKLQLIEATNPRWADLAPLLA